MKINNSLLIGAGAVGGVYARNLYNTYGENFGLIAGGDRKKRIEKNGIRVNGSAYFPKVYSPDTTGYYPDLVVIAVKNTQLEQAIKDIKNFIGENTMILPLLNGITARDELVKHFPNNHVFYGLSIYIDAVRIQDEITNTTDGFIQFGDPDNTTISKEVQVVKEYLNQAKIENIILPDMVSTVWRKWMINVGFNQVSAITHGNYHLLTYSENNRALILSAMLEVVALAEKLHIKLDKEEAYKCLDSMKHLSKNGKTSMHQDIEAKRLTEVDFFAGTVIRLGKELGIPVPVNQLFYRIILAKQEAFLTYYHVDKTTVS